MPVLFVDGMDFGDALHIMGNGDGSIPSCKYVWLGNGFSTFPAGQVVPGQGGGLAVRFDSAAFGQDTMTRFLDTSRTRLCAGFNYLAQGNFIGGSGSILLRYEDAATDRPTGNNGATRFMLFAVSVDNTLSIYTGGQGTTASPGTLLWNSAGVYALPFNTWVYIELFVDTVAGDWSLWVNDVLLQSQTGVSISGPIDRYSFRSESFESHLIDHHYLTDGEQLGPCRVTGFAPNSQSTHEWTPLISTNLSQIQEFGNRAGLNTPDDDQSYNATSGTGNTDLFGFTSPNCYGKILALALNADGRYVLPTPSVNLVTKIGADRFTVSPALPYLGQYTIRQGIFELNPKTGDVWNDAELSGNLFGYQLTGSGEARVTQFCLEKLVSLRDTPYDCGAGSYSFTS